MSRLPIVTSHFKQPFLGDGCCPGCLITVNGRTVQLLNGHRRVFKAALGGFRELTQQCLTKASVRFISQKTFAGHENAGKQIRLNREVNTIIGQLPVPSYRNCYRKTFKKSSNPVNAIYQIVTDIINTTLIEEQNHADFL